MKILRSHDLTLGYDRRIVIEELSVSLPVRQMTAIVGANGSGKSTLLKAFSRVLAPFDGRVVLDGESIHHIPSGQLAQRLSILPQAARAPDGLTVGQLVSYGRYPHRRWFAPLGEEDLQQIRWALDIVGLTALEDRLVSSLSGGQQQRVWIAMTLAQGAEVLLLDEPTTHLDLCHQLEVMELLARLNSEQNKTVVMVLHDLNLAARYAQHMIVLREGKVLSQGSPGEVMNPETVREAFGVEAQITADPHRGTPMCVAYRSVGDSRCEGAETAGRPGPDHRDRKREGRSAAGDTGT